MNISTIATRMESNMNVISSLVSGASNEHARWKPSADAWSLLEVLCHLYDEEREDFRTRIDLTLHQPDTPWPPIDPQGWSIGRGYNERDLATTLSAWLDERTKSVVWLRGLSNPDWDIARPTPWGGTIRAGDVMASWLAHDHLHIRQLNELHYLWHKKQSEPFDVGYAGDW